MIGQILRERYEIEKKLGSGGFGVTYRARDIQLPRKPLCVVKQLNLINFKPNVLPIVRDLFNREAEILSELGHHPQIPRLLDFFEDNQQFYLVQEFVEGKVLSDEIIIPGKPLSEQQVIVILTEVLNILEFIHKKQIIHRDIKPANLIRRQLDEKLVLIDFGAVKEKIITVVHNPQGQQSNSVIGTPGYMPYEQQQGQPQFNSDIYALGITGIQGLTGLRIDELPYSNPNTQEICRRQGVKVNPKLASILNKMVRYDFRDRYQSATQVLQALKTVQPHPKSIPWKILIGVGVVAIAAAIFFAFLKPNPSEPLLTYDNYNEGIKLKYPASWSNQLAAKDPITGDIAKFVTPRETEADKFQEDLIISVEDLANQPTKPTNLEQFTAFSISQIKQLNPKLNIMAQGATTVGENISAYQIIYTVKDGELNLQKMQIWLLKNNQAYTITYTAESDKYAKFENSVKSMINSLEISK